MRKFFYSFFLLLGLAGGRFVSADMIDDPVFSSVVVSDGYSTATGATTNYAVTFTTTETIAAGEGFYVSFFRNSGCESSVTDECDSLLTSATISGITGTVEHSSGNTIWFVLNNNLAAGTHSITLQNVVNSQYTGSFRLLMNVPHSFEEFGDNWVVTPSESHILIGNVLISGTITYPDGSIVDNIWTDLYKDNSYLQGRSSDQWGMYAYFADENTPAGSYAINIYPDRSLGYILGKYEFQYSGTPLVYDYTLEHGTKTLQGTVADANGNPVDDAQLWISPVSGGGGYDVDTDENGNYSVVIEGGEWDVHINPGWDEEHQTNIEVDWVYTGIQPQHVSFTDDNSEEVDELDFTVTRTTSKITGTLTSSNGETVTGSINIYNKDYNFWTWVDGDGKISFGAISGTYSLSFSPGEGYESYYLPVQDIKVGEGKNDIGELKLNQKTSSFDVLVQDENSMPLEGISISAWLTQGGGGWANATTDALGQATLLVYAGEWEINPQLDGTSYIYKGGSEREKIKDNQSVSFIFTVQPVEATLTLDLVDVDGFPLTDLYAWGNCWNEGNNFGGNLDRGHGVINLLAGDYSCSVWVDDQFHLAAPEPLEITVAEGDAFSEVITLQEKDAEANGFVKDQDGKLVKGVYVEVYAYDTENWTWYNGDFDTETGTFDIDLVGGRSYVFGVRFPQSEPVSDEEAKAQAEEMEYINSWPDEKPLKVKSGETIKPVITVFKASGSIRGQVLDPNGKPVERAWVWCGNWPEMEGNVKGDFDGGRMIDLGNESFEDGTFRLPAVTGHTYMCGAGMNPEFEDKGWMPSNEVEVRLTKNKSEVSDLVFQYVQSNASIVVQATLDGASIMSAGERMVLADSDVDVSRLSCWAWSEEGGNAWGEARKGDTIELSLRDGSWHVGCDAEYNGEWYNTRDDRTLEIAEGDAKEIQMDLVSHKYFSLYESQSTTFDSTSPLVWTLPDGTQLSAPANSIATSGNITITATPNISALRTSTDYPFGIPVDFEAFDESGNLITDFNSLVTITFFYAQDAVEFEGVEEKDLVAKYWDDDTSSWKLPDGVTQDKQNNSISVSVGHFSEFSMVYGNKLKLLSKPKTPKKFQDVSVKSDKITVSWKKVKYADSYRVRVIDKETGEVVKTVSSKKKKMTIKGLTSGTKYRLQVRTVRDGKKSSWSNGLALTTRS